MTEYEAYVKMAVAHAKTSDFSVGKLDLPQISEDLPEDFFAKVPSVADDVKCSGDRFEDGEFSIEEYL
ncbi:hypothetical protein Bca4012_093399 [Brassica carinata]